MGFGLVPRFFVFFFFSLLCYVSCDDRWLVEWVRTIKDVHVCATEAMELEFWWSSYHLRNLLKISGCLEVVRWRSKVDGCKGIVWTTATDPGGRHLRHNTCRFCGLACPNVHTCDALYTTSEGKYNHHTEIPKRKSH